MEDREQQTVEVPIERYNRLKDAQSQVVGEGWMEVARVDDETVRARPVDRQEGRDEGELIVSDEWLIEDVNGETYTVSEETFEQKYDSLVTDRFVVDLSIDPIETDDGEPDVGGNTIVAEFVAHINVPRDTVERLEVERVAIDGGVIQDGIPLEVMKDHPDINYADEEA